MGKGDIMQVVLETKFSQVQKHMHYHGVKSPVSDLFKSFYPNKVGVY